MDGHNNHNHNDNHNHNHNHNDNHIHNHNNNNGNIPKNLKQHLETTSVTIKVELSQKAALLGTGRLLRKVVEA